MKPISFAITLMILSLRTVTAADIKLSENLPAGSRTSVEVTVTLDGDMTIPAKPKPQRLAVSGSSKLIYDERSLPAEDTGTEKLLRIYKQLEIQRTVGDRKQTADIRKEVRRLVVLRNAKAKSPFSPDGPLTWNEIDVVRNDLFAPALAAGLLPNKTVKDGDYWTASPAAIRELTDLEKVTAGDLKVTFIGVVKFDNRERARLTISGSLRGIDDNGPCKHTLDGTAYVDLETTLLTYLSVKGSHELQDGDGQTLGRIDGRFTMNRKLCENVALSDDVIAKLELKPTPENTRLLYVNEELGVRFVHSRRWHIGAVQGRQVTLNGPNGAGLLITMETEKTLPTAADYRKETLAFIAKEKGAVANESKIERVREKPLTIDRFGYDADLAKDKLRLEYAVIANGKTGATLAARLPRADAKELMEDVDVVLKYFTFSK